MCSCWAETQTFLSEEKKTKEEHGGRKPVTVYSLQVWRRMFSLEVDF